MTGTTLERFASGDLVAFESLFREFQGPVFGWIMRIVRDRGAAEDLTVETFWRAWNARARFDPQREFGAWARRIASNLALNHLKRDRGVGAGFSRPFEDRPAEAGRYTDPAVDAETRETIERAFRELPPKLRAAATLALIEEEPYDEIARGLGISVNGVKSRVFRAVRILREKLEWIRAN
jgi:RNA polymerase sigma-70 factor (ECF subfamily)